MKESNGGPLSTPKLGRVIPSRDSAYDTGDTASQATLNGDTMGSDSARASSIDFSVDFETRDGSARNGKDYNSLKGTLVSNHSKIIKELICQIIFFNMV